MLLCTDTDLVRVEPNVFSEIQWLSQRLVKATGSVSGTTLTIASPDVNFDGAQLAPRMVVLIAGVAHEVVAKLSATTATISRVRPTSADAALTPAPVSGVEVIVATMMPQAAGVSDRVCRMFGLKPSPAAGDPTFAEPGEITRFAALLTLAAAYSAAASISGDDSPTGKRAAKYRELAKEERRVLTARIDLDGDGIADAVRRPSVVGLERV
jgi:hypothetical protein